MFRKQLGESSRSRAFANSDIATIAGHHNVHAEFTGQISKVLSGGPHCAMARPSTLWGSVPFSRADSCPKLWPDPISVATACLLYMTAMQQHATPIVPHHNNFSNCTVFFGNTQASSTFTLCQVSVATSKKWHQAYVRNRLR